MNSPIVLIHEGKPYVDFADSTFEMAALEDRIFWLRLALFGAILCAAGSGVLWFVETLR